LNHERKAMKDPVRAQDVMGFIVGVVISLLAEAMHRSAARRQVIMARLAAEVQQRRQMEALLREQTQFLDLS
jgi:hypothetical protein